MKGGGGGKMPFGRGKSAEKIVGAVAGAYKTGSDNRVKRQQIKDAPGAALRKLNEIDAVQPGFWGFVRAGWRPFLCWSMSYAVVDYYVLAPKFGWETVEDPNLIVQLLFILLGTFGVREAGKHIPKLIGRKK